MFRKRLGDRLVEAGLISEQQLQEALAEHKRHSLKLGEYLVMQGTVQERDIIGCLSRQLRLEVYNPEEYSFDPSLASLLPQKTALRNGVVPLVRKVGLLVVAMPDPTDINALDAVEEQTDMEVEPVICTGTELEQLTSSVYGVSLGSDGMPEEISELQYSADDAGAEPDDLRADSLTDMAEGAPVVKMVDWILTQAVRQGASDVHISPEPGHVQLRFRVDGKLKNIPSPPVNMLLPLISRIKILSQMDISVSMIPQDGRFSARVDARDINVRVSTIPTVHGENVVMRLLDTSLGAMGVEKLGMAESDRRRMQSLIQRPYGMILSTGPTGSGKTTTLYSLLRELNQPEVHLMTIEDPVEYRLKNVRQIELNPKAGMTFATGLRAILRQDPDVIMVGEIRDSETATIAVQAALTGHKVLSTVHTNSAAGAVSRLIDMGIEPLLLSSVLVVSVAQRLLRTLCTHCAEPYSPPSSVLEYWGLDHDGETDYRRSVGCHHCMHSGYRGRTGVYELLIVDDAVREMIADSRSAEEIAGAAISAGNLRTLKQHAAEKIAGGVTTFEEAMSVVAV